MEMTSKRAKVLKDTRKAKELSQLALSVRAKVPRARIKRYECGELADIDLKEYSRLCRALGLLSPTGKMPKAPRKKKAPASKKRVKKHPSKSVNLPKTRRLVLESLENKGVLDLTLRDLLSRSKAPRLVSIVIDI
jgi:transcriptional regulator with XRE-family HTH domain